MANELLVGFQTGAHLVAVITFPNGETWAGGAASAVRDNTTALAHPVALTEFAATAQYHADFPAGITAAGVYGVGFYKVATAGVLLLAELQAGAVAVIGAFPWGGTALVDLAVNSQLMLQLNGWNTGVRDEVYDGSGNLTSCSLYCYDSPAHATANDGSTGAVHKFLMAFSYVGTRQATQTISQAF